MKKTIMLLLLAFFTSAMLNAADNKKRATDLANNMEKKLGLTAEQKSKMYDVLLARFDKVEKYNKANLTPAEQTDMMYEKRNYIMDVRSVLTDDQYEKWQTIRTDQVHAFRNGEKVDEPIVDKTIELWQF